MPGWESGAKTGITGPGAGMLCFHYSPAPRSGWLVVRMLAGGGTGGQSGMTMPIFKARLDPPG